MFMQSALNSTRNPFTIFRIDSATEGAQVLTGQLAGLMDGESRYIYHHLRSGSILTLNEIGPMLAEVRFGSHRLGRLNPVMARKLQELNQSGLKYRLTIGAIIREKYLPPSAIELELEWVEEKLNQVA